MQKRLFSFIILFISGLVSYGQSKQVCFSFDDLPVVNYGISDTVYQKGIVDKLIVSLVRNKIPAIGFVNEIKLYDKDGINRFQLGLLNSWVDNGLDLGNHTYSHPDYNSVSYEDFTRDVVKGETMTRTILNSKGRSLRYFRHPFLHTGNTKARSDSLNRFLLDNGYLVAPVTIDNEDYLFASAYEKAGRKKDKELMTQIGHDYISYMEKKLKYFEIQSDSLFGRKISQILLLHASSLNSDYLDSLAFMFRNNNYVFVNMDKALEDKAYQTEITRFGNWGISWIDRWALSMGKKGSFFKDEPLTPEYIRKLSE